MGYGSGDTEKQLRKQQQEREARINEGMDAINNAFSGYTPQYFQGIRNATLSTALPQLTSQYLHNRNQLAYGLANRGMLHSSAAQNAALGLEQSRALGQTLVGNQAIGSAQEAQRQVQTEKGNLVNQLVASADPTIAAQRAVESAASISAPSMIAPLGDLFQNFANQYLAGKMANAYSSSPNGQGTAPSNWSLFGPSGTLSGNYYVKH